MQKKKKRKKKYHFLIMTDNPNLPMIKKSIRAGSLRFWGIVLVLVLVAFVLFLAHTNYNREIIIAKDEGLKQKVEELTAENSALKSEVESLTDKVNILSETVNQKAQAEQELQEKSLPTGFPLSGAGDVQDKEMEVTVNGEKVKVPILEFIAGDGVYVVASGDGEVSIVREEISYGYEVVIDHGNGYTSVYRTNAEPKVKQGDILSRGGLLYEMKGEDDEPAKMGYMILLDGEYIDPNVMLEING